MPDKDQVKPYHAEISSGQETADAVADVLKHAAERDEAAKKKVTHKGQAKWMLPLAMNLGVLAVYLLIAQPDWSVVSPIAAPPTEEQVERLRNAMYTFGINQIDQFALQNDRLPATLEEAGAGRLVGTVEYTPRPDRTYVLFATVGDADIVFDSAVQTVEQFVPSLATSLGG